MGEHSTGTVSETYHAAIQHDPVDLAGGERLVGVVRRPTPWFHAAIEENHPELGPPGALLDETKDRQEEFQMQGLCEEGAIEAAWEAVDFAERYRDYLADSDEARATMDELAEEVRDGEDVVAVCYESDDKPCHRHILVDVLRERV
jgi:hypothetical protein